MRNIFIVPWILYSSSAFCIQNHFQTFPISCSWTSQSKQHGPPCYLHSNAHRCSPGRHPRCPIVPQLLCSKEIKTSVFLFHYLDQFPVATEPWKPKGEFPHSLLLEPEQCFYSHALSNQNSPFQNLVAPVLVPPFLLNVVSSPIDIHHTGTGPPGHIPISPTQAQHPHLEWHPIYVQHHPGTGM